MIDLDHFKTINDTYGHPTGDAVLIAVAELLRSEARSYDAVGRFGGEEFAVLLPNTNTEAALMLTERIRHRIATNSISSFDNNNSAILIENLTASVGVAVHPDHGTDVNQIISTADRALHHAKQFGRNRVTLSSCASEPSA